MCYLHLLSDCLYPPTYSSVPFDCACTLTGNMLRRYDTVNARHLKYVAQFAPSIGECQAHVKALRSYLNRAELTANGVATIPIVYEPNPTRLCATGGLSLQSMPRVIRNFLIPEHTVDMDVVNSAPSVISQLCKRHDIDTPCLDAFLPVYKQRCKDISEDHTKIKALIFFSSGELIKEDTPGWLKALSTEIKEVIYPALRRIQDYSEILKRAERAEREKREIASKRQKRGGGAYNENLQGIFLSYLYFHFEDQILRAMDNAGRELNYWDDHVSLIYDGMLVTKKPGVHIDLEAVQRRVFEETGLTIKIAFKPTTNKLKVDVSKMPDKLAVVEGDEEAANLMALILEGEAHRSDNVVFIRDRGVWTDKTDVVEQFLVAKTAQSNILKLAETADGPVERVYSCEYQHARNVSKLLPRKLPDRPNFAREMVLASECKVAFNNGYWQFTPQPDPVTGVYGRFCQGEFFDSGVQIHRPFPARVQDDIDFVMEHLIDPPFDNTTAGTKERFLHAVSRALAGHLDKVTNILVGGRDSSKSVIMQFVRNAVDGYSCCIPTAIFAVRGSSMCDSYREDAWIFDVEFARIAVISEGKQTSTNETVFSGDSLKRFQSCKEGVSARRIRQNQREACSLVTGFMLLNDIPRFEPADAVQKCHIYNFVNRFVSAEEKAANPFKATYKIANPDVEHWVREPRYHAALFHILFEAYRPSKVVPSEEMMSDVAGLMEETGTAFYDRLLDITLDPQDKVAQTDVLKILKTVVPGINHPRIVRELQEIVNDRCREENIPSFQIKCFIGSGNTVGRRMAYRGFHIRDPNVGGEDNGFANGFRP